MLLPVTLFDEAAPHPDPLPVNTGRGGLTPLNDLDTIPMDFDLSDEQRQLKDSVERLLGDCYGDMKQRDAARKLPGGYDPKTWAKFAELGLTAIPFAEDHGGLGQGLVETMIVMEALGSRLALEPYLATVVLGGGVLRHAGSPALQAKLVPPLIEGKLTLALAHQEKQSRYDLYDVATTATFDGAGGYVLDGEKAAVLHGDSADHVIVSARVSGKRRDTGGIALFLVAGNAPGVTRKGYPTQDGLHGATITLKSVKCDAASVVADDVHGLAVLETVVDEAIAALAAEATGAMGALHMLTVDYLKTRKQFGVPIGSFQVLQHRSVDMFTALEQARSMAYYGTMMATDPDANERRKALSAVKVQIGKSARFVGQEAIQLHGGNGMTMEYMAGHYFKRLTMIDLAFGDHQHHLSLLARAGGLATADAAA
jgi:pimeloyl-CoA dehydrogenase small subunit